MDILGTYYGRIHSIPRSSDYWVVPALPQDRAKRILCMYLVSNSDIEAHTQLRGIQKNGFLPFPQPLAIDIPSVQYSSYLLLSLPVRSFICTVKHTMMILRRPSFCTCVSMVYPDSTAKICPAQICGCNWTLPDNHLRWLDLCHING